MNGHKFYIVDVFARRRYSGNQLAVVLPSRDLSDGEMQTMANEFHFSETAFVMPGNKRGGGYDVRIFTPAEEVPFAGHPTLGTAYVIRNHVENGSSPGIVLNLKVGQIPVNFASGSAEVLWMKQINPVFGELHHAPGMAHVLGIDESDIDERFPVQEVSTGLPFIIIPLKNLDAVKRAGTVSEAYKAYFRGRTPQALFIFSPETYARENHLNARMFAEEFGIQEDPATGSAGGCLAGYLVKHGYFGEKSIDIRMEQGYEIRRESILYLKAREVPGGIDVHVGGEVFDVAEGTMY